MIHMTKRAAKAIRERFGDPGGASLSVRVTQKRAGCGYLTLKLDTRRKTDEILEMEGVSVVADSFLTHTLGGIQIGYDASHWGGGNLTVRPLVNLETGTCGDCRC